MRLDVRTGIAAAVLGLLATGSALAQFGGRDFQQRPPTTPTNTPYDGKFHFARIRFTMHGPPTEWFEGHPDVKWDHDYPRAETHFMQILQELTTLRPHQGGGNIFALDDPELMKHPFAYLCEPGFWAPNDAEAAGLRAYLAKGGFIIFDDFFGARAWDNFSQSIHKVLPQAQLVRLDGKQPVFDAFFRVEQLEQHAINYGRRGPPEFWGIYEDNDQSKRLIAVVNYNNDIGESWEWSDTGALPVDVTSTSYKLGVNYLMYAFTH
jgi:hypothetical protein